MRSKASSASNPRTERVGQSSKFVQVLNLLKSMTGIIRIGYKSLTTIDMRLIMQCHTFRTKQLREYSNISALTFQKWWFQDVTLYCFRSISSCHKWFYWLELDWQIRFRYCLSNLQRFSIGIESFKS